MLRVLSVRSRSFDRPVFNVEVETDHTFFVGSLGALVHNTCRPRPARPAVPGDHWSPSAVAARGAAHSPLDSSITQDVARLGLPRGEARALRASAHEVGTAIQENGIRSIDDLFAHFGGGTQQDPGGPRSIHALTANRRGYISIDPVENNRSALGGNRILVRFHADGFTLRVDNTH